MQIKTPVEITDAAIAAGNAKVARTLHQPVQLLVSAILAGAFIAIGGILSLIVGFGFPEITAGNPSLQRLLSGMMFPIGLILVVVLGAELFTGNNAMLIPGYMKRDFTLSAVIRNWSIVYIGNLIGAVTFTWLLVYTVGLTSAEPYHSSVIGIGMAKTSMTWPVVLVKGIGANWFVCLGVWLALSGHTFFEKALGCWLPVMAFVVLGYEHSIANMFYLPLAMLEGAPLSVDTCLTNNILPATIGNIIGGALFVGCVHTYLHHRRK
ncbi:formate/nitrite transporter family protein [Muribaculaceae bacterium Isolate-002 (NCI)]|nr:formate/nitrite transporter family protein [Muribaculaceae bacterium Isolate-002 (NCI)]